MENEGKNLKLELMKICWYMRGGMSWNESLNLSPDERDIARTLVKENMEVKNDYREIHIFPIVLK